jgi:uncharacterized protein (AIM24 family)
VKIHGKGKFKSENPWIKFFPNKKFHGKGKFKVKIHGKGKFKVKIHGKVFSE